MANEQREIQIHVLESRLGIGSFEFLWPDDRDKWQISWQFNFNQEPSQISRPERKEVKLLSITIGPACRYDVCKASGIVECSSPRQNNPLSSHRRRDLRMKFY
jgi:hypothetical protein